mgnify:CR=1 FL=1
MLVARFNSLKEALSGWGRMRLLSTMQIRWRPPLHHSHHVYVQDYSAFSSSQLWVMPRFSSQETVTGASPVSQPEGARVVPRPST